MQTQIENMGKVQLRAACRDAKVKGYSKMSVATMRTALKPSTPAPELKPVTRTSAKDAAPAATTVREVRNGVKRPLDQNGKCGQVWAALDELVAKGETDLTTAIHAIGEKRGWNKSNTSIELSAYRRFFGISKEANAA